MLELKDDLWSCLADVRVIPTNGEVDRHGNAVMGAGVALEAKLRHPETPKELGWLLTASGNHVYSITHTCPMIVAFPTKHQWRNPSDLKLICRSAKELVKMTSFHDDWDRIVLPRVGTGRGGLAWKDVKAILEPLFDDRFVVVSH